MAFTLKPEIHLDIFKQLKSSFSDFHLFDCLVADKLKQAIKDSNSIEINIKTTKKVAERYFDVRAFTTPAQKLLWAQITLIFKTCYVLILSYQDYPRSLTWPDIGTLLVHYPKFAEADQEELQLLLNFRNMLKITLLLIPARLNKQCVLKIAGRLEGSQNEYITGGGQKPAVTRRVEIYEKEGGITAEKRPDRSRPHRDDNEFGKRAATTANMYSEKKLKIARMMRDEMKFLQSNANDPYSVLQRRHSYPVDLLTNNTGIKKNGDESTEDDEAETAINFQRSGSGNNTMYYDNNYRKLSDAEDGRLSPLSALSAAAARMPLAYEHIPSSSIVNKVSSSSTGQSVASLMMPTNSITAAVLSVKQQPFAVEAIHANSAAIKGIPTLPMLASEHSGRFNLSDFDYWNGVNFTDNSSQSVKMNGNSGISNNSPPLAGAIYRGSFTEDINDFKQI